MYDEGEHISIAYFGFRDEAGLLIHKDEVIAVEREADERHLVAREGTWL